MRVMGRVRVLPDELINRIAAGEVVERPASVVKELVENALDAGAGRVVVELEAGGRRRVRVADDGHGMNEDDALLALERHATSKLSGPEELGRITTLGFRGEALPSIAAVSRFELVTCADPGEGGTRVLVEGGRITAVEPAARARGTTVTVRDLFWNVPARRKFLRSVETELRHIAQGLEAEALAAPGVGFELHHGSRVLLELPPADGVARRLADLTSRRAAGGPRGFEERRGELLLEGRVAPGGGAGGPRLLALVNGRPVKDRLLTAAMRRPLRGTAERLGGAWLVLRITLPAEEVDVNVHPAKAEVRFARAGAVFAAVEAAVRRGLTALHGEVAVRGLGTPPPAPQPPGDAGGTGPAAPAPLFSHPVYGGEGRVGEPVGLWGAPPPRGRPAAPVVERRSGARQEAADTPFGRLIGQYRSSFLLLDGAEGLLIVDQHVAHERVLYEQFLGRLEQGRAPAQGLLEPILVELEPALAEVIPRAQPLLAAAGVEVDRFGETAARITALPPELDAGEAEGLLLEVLEAVTRWGEEGVDGPRRLREELAASLSCRAAVKVNHPLTREEQLRLLHDLARTADPYRCPHGRPIVLTLRQEEMERRLGRR